MAPEPEHADRQTSKDPDALLSRLSPGARLAVYISLGGNGVLFLGKLALGWHINSLSVVADGFHSLSDSFTTLLVLLGLWAAAKAPDAHHPYGHGRAEYIGTLIMAVLLVVIGLELGRTALGSIWGGSSRDIQAGPATILFIFATAAIKEAMAQYIYGLGRAEDSQLICADALHHRLDALTSLAVGIGLIGVWAGAGFMDDLLTLVIGGFIIYSGMSLGSGAVRILMGGEPSPELEKRIIQTVLSVEGVLSPHRIWVHDYGSSREVTLHIGVDGDLPLRDAHDLADIVESRLEELVSGTVIVHIDPEHLVDD